MIEEEISMSPCYVCESEYASYDCWECPDWNAPSHEEILEHERKKKCEETKTMKIIILHWHGICSRCGNLSCIYADFYHTENGTKLPNGFECDFCKAHFSDEEFSQIQKVQMKCPREAGA